jgi:exodeoxyribonuclease V alpha subunit
LGTEDLSLGDAQAATQGERSAMNDLESLVGRVYSVVFNKEDYYILNFDVEGSRPVKAKGSFHGLTDVRCNVPIKLIGQWSNNAKYGREFTIRSWEPWAETVGDVKVFLHNCVPGFADLTLVHALVDRFGLGTFEQLTSHPSDVANLEAAGVSRLSLEQAVLGWERTLATRDLSTLLREGGLNAADVRLAMGRFGMEAARIVASNPFRLMEIAGFSFPKVDRLALHMGCRINDPRRVQGIVLWALQEAAKQQGHLYVPRGEIPEQARLLCERESVIDGSGPTIYARAIAELLEQGAAVLEPTSGLYLPSLHGFEQKAAERLARLAVPSPIEVDLTLFLDEYERAHGLKLSEAQRHAVELLTKFRVLTITGLPGTGKTTVLRTLVRLLEQFSISFSLMAPTGIAAKRLASVTGHHASTVHRALRFDGAAWGHDESNPYVTDAVILDEASMMDQELFYRLLSALRPDTRLVLVGDAAQLPSVGPGNVLRELIDCKVVPHVQLTEIFRQAAQGEIVVNSHKINSGQMPEFEGQRVDSEFKFIRLSDEHRILEHIVVMATKLKARDANFQVLSPKYEGVVGVDNLNERLRDALNPAPPGELGPREFKMGAVYFREGDRLMVTQNDYKLNIYNGDVGKLIRVGRDDLTVKIYGIGKAMDMDVVLPHDLAERKLRLAYAITAHKSQGSEFDTIILPIVSSQGRMLQRNLLYTAVTRAKKRVWLLGEEIAIQRAIQNNKVIQRNTALSRAVCEKWAAMPTEVSGASHAD